MANRFAKTRKSPDERLSAEPVESNHLVDVGAADERLLTGPTQHDGPHVIVFTGDVEMPRVNSSMAPLPTMFSALELINSIVTTPSSRPILTNRFSVVFIRRS